jgi:hypothetical protein
MAIPLTAMNPWDLDEETKMPKRIIFTEALYAYEKNKSILQFKYLHDDQSKNVLGCSKFLNKIFGRNF